jgi:hypothetical protein
LCAGLEMRVQPHYNPKVGMTDEPRVSVGGICRWTPLQKIRIWDHASRQEVSPAIENPNDDVVPPVHQIGFRGDQSRDSVACQGI